MGGGEQCGNVTLLHWKGAVGKQCGKVTLPHCHPPPSSAEGAESEGENERGPSQRGGRGRSRVGEVGGEESVGA
jgi:hypothetical protein